MARRKNGYSDLVLEGLRLCGHNDASIRNVARISEVMFTAIASGARELTGAQKLRLEKLAGKTAGQLAALALEPRGGDLTDLVDEWAAFRDLARRSLSK